MSDPDLRVVVARTGVANLASVGAACRRAGLQVVCTDDPDIFQNAALAVLPGVGSFAAGMQTLRATGLDQAVAARAALARPLLAVCLGLQMLCEHSDESPGVAGLGIVPTRVTALNPHARGNAGQASRVRVPQLGWNAVRADAGGLLRDGVAYFANSYAASTLPTGWRGAWFAHGDRRLAAIERGNLLACQFHPELSGPWGQALIERWVRASVPTGAPTC